MSEIFISYARSTSEQAKLIAEALRSLRYSVWIDDDLPAHRDYAEVIEEHLRAAKAVVVLWSADAVKSRVGAGGGRYRPRGRQRWSSSTSTARRCRCRSTASSART